VVLKLLKTAEQLAKADSDGKADKAATKEMQQLVSDKKAKAEAKAKAQFERDWRANLVADSWVAIRDDAEVKPFTVDVHRFLAVRAANNLSAEDAARICELLDLGKVSPRSAIADYARETAAPDMLHLLIIMQEASGTETHTYGGRVPNEGLMLVAGNVFGKQLDDVIKEIKAEVKALIWPKVTKKPLPATAPAARPEEGAGGTKDKVPASKKPPARATKLSAEEATQGIAAAMQGIDGAASAPEGAVALPAEPAGVPVGLGIGSTVKITTELLNPRQQKYAGKKGTITGKIGIAWDVTFKGRTGGISSFTPDQLTAVAA
jgi:hypothetical protein